MRLLSDEGKQRASKRIGRVRVQRSVSNTVSLAAAHPPLSVLPLISSYTSSSSLSLLHLSLVFSYHFSGFSKISLCPHTTPLFSPFLSFFLRQRPVFRSSRIAIMSFFNSLGYILSCIISPILDTMPTLTVHYLYRDIGGLCRALHALRDALPHRRRLHPKSTSRSRLRHPSQNHCTYAVHLWKQRS